MWLRGKVEDVELLEELEERGEVNLEAITKEEPKTTSRKESTARATPSPVPKPALPTKQIISNPKQPLASEVLVPAPSANVVTSLIESLTIHERPVPSVAPAPPSLSGPVDHSTSSHAPPAVEPQPLPLPQPQPQPSLSSHARRNPNSLLSPSSTLTRSLLSATNSIPAAAISQSSPNGDDSEEEESEASEWEKEMRFGEETEEVKGWFEEAMAAREMLGDKEETEE